MDCVGHTIKQDGIIFPKKKIEFVVNFARPNTQKQLKSFIGKATYFHTHIRNFAIIKI